MGRGRQHCREVRRSSSFYLVMSHRRRMRSRCTLPADPSSSPVDCGDRQLLVSASIGIIMQTAISRLPRAWWQVPIVPRTERKPKEKRQYCFSVQP